MKLFGRIFRLGRQKAEAHEKPEGEYESHRRFIGEQVGILNGVDMMIERATNASYRHCAIGKITLKQRA